MGAQRFEPASLRVRRALDTPARASMDDARARGAYTPDARRASGDWAAGTPRRPLTVLGDGGTRPALGRAQSARDLGDSLGYAPDERGRGAAGAPPAFRHRRAESLAAPIPMSPARLAESLGPRARRGCSRTMGCSGTLPSAGGHRRASARTDMSVAARRRV
jgi:hypothetical protein